MAAKLGTLTLDPLAWSKYRLFHPLLISSVLILIRLRSLVIKFTRSIWSVKLKFKTW